MRLLDVVASAIGLVLISPLFIFISVLIKLRSCGPIFYRGLRVGKNGKHFHMYKFRSMVPNADQVGPGITAIEDNRITFAGKILRRLKLDELPQLINVLKGDMSLIGPRPEDPRYVALYTPEQREILGVRPGITSAASLAYRHEEQMLSGKDWETVYRTRILPAKLAIDLDYLSGRTFWSDLRLIMRTIFSMFHGK